MITVSNVIENHICCSFLQDLDTISFAVNKKVVLTSEGTVSDYGYINNESSVVGNIIEIMDKWGTDREVSL